MQENMLQPGTIVKSPEAEYRIVKVLGQYGAEITYLCEILKTTKPIYKKLLHAVKKRLLSHNERSQLFILTELSFELYCQHKGTTGSAANNDFEQDKTYFTNRILRLMELRHVNITRITETFQANGTAYFAMQYVEGEPLRHYIPKNGSLDERQVKTLMSPICDAVKYLHDNRVAHLDINPDNIIIRLDKFGNPIPILNYRTGFHSSTISHRISRPGVPVMRLIYLMEGYAPMEQYVACITPQIDIYALAATMLFCITGEDPVRASEASSEWVRSTLPDTVSSNFANAIVHAMSQLKSNRTPDIATLVQELEGNAIETSADIEVPETKPNDDNNTEIITKSDNKNNVKADNKTERISLDKSKGKKPNKKWLIPTFIVVGIIAIAIVTNPLFSGGSNDSSATAEGTAQINEFEAYTNDINRAISLFQNNEFEPCKECCDSLLLLYPKYAHEIDSLIADCDSAITANMNYTISGAVYDVGGYGIYKAKISPIGGGDNTYTDVNAQFTLEVPSSVSQIYVSHSGYYDKTINVSRDSSPLEIVLTKIPRPSQSPGKPNHGNSERGGYSGEGAFIRYE